ncbi:LamG domain-containing protein [Haliscomenobacter hydrossis]|nr:LamG domain-containing protein [Haliscomenobacter hydrossis]
MKTFFTNPHLSKLFLLGAMLYAGILLVVAFLVKPALYSPWASTALLPLLLVIIREALVFSRSLAFFRRLQALIRSTPSVGPPRPKGAGLALSLIIGLGLFALCMPPAYRYFRENRVVRLVHHFDQPENTWLKKAQLRIHTPTKMGRTDITVTYKPVQIKNRRSIKKVVRIQPQFDQDLNAKMSFAYTDAELDGLSEERLILYSSADEGKTWQAHLNSVVNAENNTVYLEGIEHFSLWTVAPPPPDPGGVSNGLALWLKADEGLTPGATLTWLDQSTSGLTATQPTMANQPTLNNNAINFNPSLVFANNVNNFLTVSAPALPTGNISYSVFGVAKASILTGGAFAYNYLYVEGVDAGNQRVSVGRFNALMSQANYINDLNAGAITANTPLMLRYTRNSTGGTRTNVRNGLQVGTDVNTGLNKTNVAGYPRIGNTTAGAGEEAWDGDISEIIVYNGVLTATQYQQVESYLGLKYGITMDQTTPTNYLASDGSTIWNSVTNSTYKNDIFGIGRDDNQGLNQKQSKSVNPGFQPILSTTTFAATNAANTTGFTADKSFEIAGSDAGAANFGTAYAFAGMTHRITRLWKIQETGTVGNIKVAIEKSQMSGNASNVNLLVSGDVTFDNSDTKTAMTLETVGGVEYYTATVDFTSGQFFTFGVFLVTPGCVAANLKAWYKADVGVTGTSTVTAWADQSGNGIDVIQATPTQAPALSGLINFNPTLLFDGAGDHLEYKGARFLTTSSSGTMYGAATNDIDGGLENLAVLGIDNPHMGINATPGSGVNQQEAFMWMNTSSPVYFYNPTKIEAKRAEVYGFFWNGGSPNVGSGLRRNGTETLDPLSEATGVASSGSADGMWSIGAYEALEPWNGSIPEIILYDRNLTNTEKQKIESYLAIKYGSTLSQNYLAGDGSTIYDISTYGNNVFGIGRDDCQGLEQKQSKSQNTGFQPILSTTTFAATNVANTTGFTADKSFEIAGSDAGATSFGTAYAFSAMTHRITRLWKIQETGTVGNIKVAIEKSQMSGNASNVNLLVSGDVTFDNSDTKTAMTLETVGGVEYYTATVDFTSGQFFTFGAYLVTPGCVAANLLTWYKATDGVTGSPSVSA